MCERAHKQTRYDGDCIMQLRQSLNQIGECRQIENWEEDLSPFKCRKDFLVDVLIQEMAKRFV